MVRSRAQQTVPFVFGRIAAFPPLRDEHIDVSGTYIWATQEDATKTWRGYALFESNSASSGFVRRQEYGDRATVARVISSTNLPVDHRLIDYANTIRIELLHPNDSLDVVTEQEMLTGRSRFMVGREMIGAATPTLVSTNEFTGLRTYDLTVMLRGLKGTQAASLEHQPGEQVVALDYGGVYFLPYAISRVGETSYFKFVANGGLATLASAVRVVLGGSTVRPFCPISIEGTRDGSNNLTVTWERQARRSIQFVDQDVPIDAEVEKYKIHVLAAAGSETALRAVTITGAKTWTYTAGQQLTDGLTPGNPVTIHIVQMGSIAFEGVPAEITL